MIGVAGWWLVRGAAIVTKDIEAIWPPHGLMIAIQVLGVYFAVGGAISLIDWLASGLLMSGGWESAAGKLASAGAQLVAGLVLVTRPTAIALWLADQR